MVFSFITKHWQKIERQTASKLTNNATFCNVSVVWRNEGINSTSWLVGVLYFTDGWSTPGWLRHPDPHTPPKLLYNLIKRLPSDCLHHFVPRVTNTKYRLCFSFFHKTAIEKLRNNEVGKRSTIFLHRKYISQQLCTEIGKSHCWHGFIHGSVLRYWLHCQSNVWVSRTKVENIKRQIGRH